MTDTKYLSCAETAKLVRKALKDAFSGQKFSVRSKTYSLGASISVSWLDGPTTKAVEAVTNQFKGAGFDGSIDLKYYVDHWLLPDGSTVISHSHGTTGSRGVYEPIKNDKPHPDAELVSFGADYVFANRDYSPQALETIAQAVVADLSQYGNTHIPSNWSIEVSDYDGSGHLKCDDYMPCISGGYENFRDLVFQKSAETDLYQPPAAPTPPTSTPNSECASDGYRVEHDRDWTWVYFDQKPAVEIRDALTAKGAHWSRRRRGWYFREAVSEETIAAIVGDEDPAKEDGKGNNSASLSLAATQLCLF